MGAIKSYRVVYYRGGWFNFGELYVWLCVEGWFVDVVVVVGGFYFVCEVNVYVVGVGDVCVFYNC